MIHDFSQLQYVMICIMYSLIYSQVYILILTLTVDWENKGKYSAMVSPSQYFTAFNKTQRLQVACQTKTSLSAITKAPPFS